jgi:hypothetical protein
VGSNPTPPARGRWSLPAREDGPGPRKGFAGALVAIVDLSDPSRTLERRMDLILGWRVLSQADWYVDHDGARAACIPRT